MQAASGDRYSLPMNGKEGVTSSSLVPGFALGSGMRLPRGGRFSRVGNGLGNGASTAAAVYTRFASGTPFGGRRVMGGPVPLGKANTVRLSPVTSGVAVDLHSLSEGVEHGARLLGVGGGPRLTQVR